MKKLIFEFNCLDGYYILTCKQDDVINYSIETNIEGFVSKQGSLNENEKFNELLKKANIKSWDNDYSFCDIEDGCKWSITLDDKNIKGSETHEPYGYEYFVEAIGLIEENYNYFNLWD